MTTSQRLQNLSDEELVAEVRQRTIGIVQHLGSLQLIRAHEALREIAPEVADREHN